MGWRGRARHSYFVDSVEATDSGTLVFRENKAHTAYFEDVRIAEKLAVAEAELTRYPNVSFEREVGTD